MTYALVIEAQDILIVLGVLAVIAIAAGVVWYQFRKGGTEAADKAIANWKSLYESEEEKNTKLTKQVEEYKQAHDECEKLRNEFAQHNLRLQARCANYERCINRLELRLDLEPTNFDDPTQHNTENPHS